IPTIVDTWDEDAPGALTAVTVNASIKTSVSPSLKPVTGVVTVIVRGASVAVGEIVIFAVAVAGSGTWTVPAFPGAPPPTYTPFPKRATVWPGSQWVLSP